MMNHKHNNSMIKSLSVVIALLFVIEIFTYSMVYLNLKNNTLDSSNNIIFFIVPPIICLISFYISFKSIADEEKSIFATLLSILAGWTPFFLVPTFIDNSLLETTFNNLEIVKLLPKISIAIGVLSILKGIGDYEVKTKQEKELERERILQMKKERREAQKQQAVRKKYNHIK